jgi:protease-4
MRSTSVSGVSSAPLRAGAGRKRLALTARACVLVGSAALVGPAQLLGCGQPAPRERADAAPPTLAPVPGREEPSSPGWGNLGALGAMLSQRASAPGAYADPAASPALDPRAPHTVVLALDRPVVELQRFELLGAGRGVELRVVTATLAALAADDAVAGALVRLDGLAIDLARAEELRAALLAFRSAGGRARGLACHAERLTDATYYLATACDTIALAPSGELALTGAAAMPIHIKSLLAKMGVAADFVHIGAFKGAAEPLTRDAPSPEMKQTLTAVIDRAYATLVAGIVEGRQLAPATVRALIDRALLPDRAAVAAGLIDRVATFEAFRASVAAAGGWRRGGLADAEPPGMAAVMSFLGLAPRRRPTQPHVALVYALGDVVDGTGEGLMGTSTQIASRTLVPALRALAADDAVDAVVVRIDSPGGSALASELILRAMQELADAKPVVVSMAGVAASGGYYIACRAHRIYALGNTLTGSIGVVGGKLVVRDALAKLGVSAHPMGRGERALMWSPMAPWTPAEREAVRASMAAVYATFVDHVAAGRHASHDAIDQIAKGRVWTGADAVDRGLVDQLGGLDAALAEARRLGGVDADAALEIYPPEPTLLDWVGALAEARALLPYGLGAVHEAAFAALGSRGAAAVEGYLRQLALFRDSAVLAALFWPVVR